MPYIQGKDRNQLSLTPMCLDDFIDENSVCRVIEAYVLSLDMSALGFKYSHTKITGRPPFNPANMLMLYVYGYMNRARSSRRLEAEARRNVEVMWLMEGLAPDDKTICNFRKDNAIALKKTFREFSLWCNRQDLYGRKLVAVDGTKTRANSNARNIYSKKLVEKQLAETDKKIENI
jgi:transposase